MQICSAWGQVTSSRSHRHFVLDSGRISRTDPVAGQVLRRSVIDQIAEVFLHEST